MDNKRIRIFLMTFIYYLYSIMVILSTSLLSLFYIVTCWWFLFLPKYKRYKLFDFLVVYPWVSIVNNIFLGMRLKLIGSEYIDIKRTTMYICNHQSWLDIPVVIKQTHTICLSKKQVRRMPLVGLLIVFAGPIIVDRDDQSSRISSVKEIISVFKKGYSLALFPEGTRSMDGKLIKPNTAMIKLCYKLNIPVVSTAVEGTRDVLPRNRLYMKFLQKVVLKFNPPIYPEDFNNEENFVNACWDKVKETHNDILMNFFPERIDHSHK